MTTKQVEDTKETGKQSKKHNKEANVTSSNSREKRNKHKMKTQKKQGNNQPSKGANKCDKLKVKRKLTQKSATATNQEKVTKVNTFTINN